MKKMEQELVMRIMSLHGEMPYDDDVSSREESVHSQQDSDGVRPLQITQYIKLKMTICKT